MVAEHSEMSGNLSDDEQLETKLELGAAVSTRG